MLAAEHGIAGAEVVVTVQQVVPVQQELVEGVVRSEHRDQLGEEEEAALARLRAQLQI